MATYPSILSGQTITAALLTSMIPDVVVKAANETVTSSTTFQDDNDLFVSVSANATYEVKLFLLHDSDATAAGDIKIQWTAPAASTMTWGSQGANVSTTSSSAVTETNMQSRTISENAGYGGGDSTGTVAFIQGVLTTSATAGTLQLQWAQNTSNAVASTVRAGSTLSVRRIA